MIEREADELLWEATGAEGEADGAIPPDGALRAYREGRLSEIEARHLEWALGRSAAGRARLVALAGVSLARPSRGLRRRVLGRPAAPLGAWRSWHVAAAIVIAGAMISYAILQGSRDEPLRASLPAGLSYDVRVEGLAVTRGKVGRARALPETTVRIFVEPSGHEVSGIDLAVFAPSALGFRRLEPGAELTVERHRGSAVFTARAESLVGPEPGTRDLYVVVAPEGSLPHASGFDPETAAASGALVYRRALTIVAREAPAETDRSR